MNKIKVLTIMRRLARPGGRIVPARRVKDKDGGAACYELVVACSPAERSIAIPAASVKGWLADGLIEPSGEGYAISAAGLSWLRRRLSAGDEFAAQHQERRIRVVEVGGARRTAIVNDAESPLRWLAKRKDKAGKPMLEPFQLEAGERLRADYQFAGLTSRVTASWNPAAQGGGVGAGANDAAAMLDNVMAARQRVVRAVAAVGPELAGILVDVCCHLKGLEEAERHEGFPQRSGKVVLQLALTRLARHYGLVSDSCHIERLKRRLTHWGTEDYRPRLSSGGDGKT